MFKGAKVRSNVVQRFRDSHHMMARLFASGKRVSEVAQEMGMSISRVSVFHTDPAFQELIAAYRADVDDAFREQQDETYRLLSKSRNRALRHLDERGQQLEDEGDWFTVREALAIISDTSDRTGYGKRTMAINVNIDAAGQIDRARKRAAPVMKIINPPALPAPFKRRI